jgi:hypothetical protein
MGWRSAPTGSDFLLAAALACATSAYAAHPLITEDTGTQGEGRYELELGLAGAKDDTSRIYEFGPQLSCGLVANVDLIARPAWVEVRNAAPEGAGRERGAGDTALDFKWRFHEGDGFSVGTRAGVALATGDAVKGLGAGKASFHGVVIGQLAIPAWTLIANLGYLQDPVPGERPNLWYGTAAAVWHAAERLRLSAEAAAFSPADPSRSTWPAVARFGAIVTAAPWLDLDVGYQFRLNRAAQLRVILAGATLHW